MKEKDILKQCTQYLTFRGYIVIRNNTGFIPITSPNGKRRAIRMGTPGSPDIIACYPDGRFVAIECKSHNGRLTAMQKAFLEELKKNNATVIIARSIGGDYGKEFRIYFKKPSHRNRHIHNINRMGVRKLYDLSNWENGV